MISRRKLHGLVTLRAFVVFVVVCILAMVETNSETIALTPFQTDSESVKTEQKMQHDSLDDTTYVVHFPLIYDYGSAKDYLERAREGEFRGSVVEILGDMRNKDEVRLLKSLETFEQQTGIDVVYNNPPEIYAILPIRIEAGDPPDIVISPPEILDFYAKNGDIVDVRSFTELTWLQSQYVQSWLDMATVAGPNTGDIMMGVWYLSIPTSLVWHPKDDFDAASYVAPDTWDEMIALMDEIVATGDSPWCEGIEAGNATGWPATHWLAEIMLRTISSENYDRWVDGDLLFQSSEVRIAAMELDSLLSDNYVYGGRAGLVTTYFGNAPKPMFKNPPDCWFHKQGAWITSHFPEGNLFSQDYDVFYLPPIDEQYGKPMLVHGRIAAMFQDRPEVRAVMQYLATGESTKGFLQDSQQNQWVSPHRATQLDWYEDPMMRKVAGMLQQATIVRYQGSALMPGQVVVSFWEEITNWLAGDIDLDTMLYRIDSSWPH